MISTLPVLKLDPRTYDRALSCVHCGLCLPACPTYTQTFNEADSPRGRIQIMRGLADGAIEPTAGVREHLDLCLDCRACETACPSGVVYHELIEETRARLAVVARPSFTGRFMTAIFFHVFTHSTRLKFALLPARVLQKLGVYPLLRRLGIFRALPLQWRKMEQMLPRGGQLWPRELRGDFRPAEGQKARKRVGLFTGCVGSVLFDPVNRMAVDLLTAAGAEVTVPPQPCCGAIHHHGGAPEQAMGLAKRNIDAFMPPGSEPPDWIVTNVAGCGAMLREYDHLLRDDPLYAERAVEFSRRVRDITEVLAELGLPEMKHPIERTVTYHDACHLAHAQGVTAAPRALLARIPGLKVVPLAESDMCCGAAGTYNLTEPGMATDLARRKLGHIAATGAPTCATGNAGCALHIQSEADARGQALEVIHPVQLLHSAVFGTGKG